jgi:hypothetical protein
MKKEVWKKSKEREGFVGAKISSEIMVKDKEGGDSGHGNLCHLYLNKVEGGAINLNGDEIDYNLGIILSFYGTDEISLALETVTFWKEQLEKAVKESGLGKSGYFQKGE